MADEDNVVDISNMVIGARRYANAQAIAGMDESPDDAARSLELSKASGVPAPIVHGDLEGFEKNFKTKLASDLLKNNEYLQRYVEGFPLANVLSNDDYGNLDKSSESISKLHGYDRAWADRNRVGIAGFERAAQFDSAVSKAINEGLGRGFIEGYGDQPLGSWMNKGNDPTLGQTILGATVLAPLTGIENVLRALSGGIKAFVEGSARGAEEAALQFGVDQSSAQRIGREIGGLAEKKTTEPFLHVPAPERMAVPKRGSKAEGVRQQGMQAVEQALDPAKLEKATEAIRAAKPWLDAGVEPPMGVHPVIDEIKNKQSDIDLKDLAEAEKDAQKSATRERSPEAYAHFVATHGEKTIGISPDAVRKLYGDKVPEPEDGKLGFIPRLQDQLQLAELSGDDIRVPVSDWLAHVDPEVAKELRDDIRVRAGGVTKNEAKALASIDVYHGSPHEFEAFDLGKAGTGEGAQAYGFGHYVAENPEVAKSYAVGRQTGTASKVNLPGNPFSGAEVLDVKPPSLYRVRIKRNAEEFLDWDKSFAEQPPKVQEALRKIIGETKQPVTETDVAMQGIAKQLGAKEPTKSLEQMQGSELYHLVILETGRRKQTPFQRETFGDSGASFRGKPEEASKLLAEAGIPGIKFLDQGSRGKVVDSKIGAAAKEGSIKTQEAYIEATENLIKQSTDEAQKARFQEKIVEAKAKIEALKKEVAQLRKWETEGTRNFVVFSDADLEILSRNGEALRQARASAGLPPTPEEALAKLQKEDLGAGVVAFTKPTEAYTASETKIVEKVKSILSRMAPQLEDVRVVPRLEMEGKPIGGAFITNEGVKPLIAIALDSRDAGKTARHEGLHYLRELGFFSKEEWKGLTEAAESGQWMGKYDIRDRYKRHAEDIDALVEEAIAEELGTWGSKTETARNMYNKAVKDALNKLAQFFKDILEVIKEAFGHTPKIDELFEKIESGEVGRRAQEGQGQGGVKTQQPELPGITRMEDRKPFERGVAMGLTQAQYEKYLKLIEKQRAEDQAKALERVVTAERRRQSAEWKSHEVEERKLAVEDINARRDIQADKYLRDGELFGDTVPKVKLNGEYLTLEQRNALPKTFVNDASGMHPDDLASLFGYHSGAELVDDLGKLHADRLASGMRPMDYNRRLIAAETERRMQEKYGDLRENVLQAAKDQMLSETQLDLLHEETIAAAERAGAELPIKRQQVVEGIREQVEGLKQADISSDAYLAAAGRAGREAEAALLKGDFQEAFRQKQRQYMAIVASKEAMEIEKEQTQFEAKAKRYMGRDLPKSVETEYGNYIQQLLAEAGRVGRLSPEEIAKSVAFQGYESLDAFVTDKSSYGHELEVPLGYKPKALDEMTVGEFREFKAAIDTLDKAGRDEKKINVAGEKQDYVEWRDRAIEALRQRPVRSAEAIEKGGNWLYAIDASMTKIEELMKSLDFREEMGPFFSTIMQPYELSKAKKFTMITDLSAKLKKLSGDKAWQRSLEEVIPQDFVHDLHTGTGMELTRWNMIKMMLNFGTEQNLNKLAQGIASARQDGKIADKASTAAMRAQVEAWVHQNATAKDWKFVQEIFDLFEGWKGEADTVYRNLAGRPPKWIPSREIVTPHGTFAGGYFPLIPDKLRSNLFQNRGISEGTAPGGKGPLGSDYYKATTATPFYKERTGAAYFVDITNGVENLAGRMQQVIHDIAYRDFVVNASKIIYDPKVMNEIKRHYGPEYAAQLEPWLKRVANENTGFEAELQGWNNVLRQAKGNLMLHALPLNYAVMLSPSTGVLNVKAMVAFNANRAANKALVTQHSKELPHILYSLDRDITDVLTTAAGQRGWSSFQKHAAEVMMRPLVWMEQQTRMVTFYSEFMKQKEKGLSDADAAVLADSRIRTEHGAAGYGDLPALMASKNQFVQVATTFMGWFNTQRNWLRQVPDQARQGDIKGMSKTLWGTIGIAALFNAALFQPRKESDTLGSFLAKSVLSTPMTMVPYVREGWNYYTQGFQPTSPIFGLFKAVGELLKDGLHAAQGKKVKHPIRHTANVIGQGAGVPGTLQVGRTGEFISDVAKGEQRPRNIIEWMRGLATGEARLRK